MDFFLSRRFCSYQIRQNTFFGVAGGHTIRRRRITGEVVLTQTDFVLPGRIPLTWTRHYGSQSDYEGLLGRGWQTPADARLEIDADGMVTFYDGTPKAAVFGALPEQTPVMETADGALLEAGQDHYKVRLKSGIVYHFGRQLNGNRTHVVQISNPDGHFLRFIREDHKLVQIQDNSGQRIQIVCEHNRIVQVQHLDKLLVQYHYQGDALIGAMDPLGHQKRYYYENDRLVRHMDKNNLSFFYQYDTEGRCIHTHGGNGLYACDLEYRPYERCTWMTCAGPVLGR